MMFRQTIVNSSCLGLIKNKSGSEGGTTHIPTRILQVAPERSPIRSLASRSVQVFHRLDKDKHNSIAIINSSIFRVLSISSILLVWFHPSVRSLRSPILTCNGDVDIMFLSTVRSQGLIHVRVNMNEPSSRIGGKVDILAKNMVNVPFQVNTWLTPHEP